MTGDGSPGDPYRVAVTAGVDLLLTRRDGTAPGSVVDVALAASLAQPLALGAAARADVRVGLLHADLAAGTAALATGLVAALFLGREDATPTRLTADGYGLLLDGVGARIAWDAATGARVDPWLDGLSLVLDGVERPLVGIGVGGPTALAFPPSLPPEVGAWSEELTAALEDVAGALLLSRARAVTGEVPDAVAALLTLVATATGWGGGSRPPGLARLSIAALLDDAGAELRRWVGALLATGAGTTGRLPEIVVGLLARLLGTSLTGTGVDAIPWTLALPGAQPPVAAGGRGLVAPLRRRPAVVHPGPRSPDARPVRQPGTRGAGRVASRRPGPAGRRPGRGHLPRRRRRRPARGRARRPRPARPRVSTRSLSAGAAPTAWWRCPTTWSPRVSRSTGPASCRTRRAWTARSWPRCSARSGRSSAASPRGW